MAWSEQIPLEIREAIARVLLAVVAILAIWLVQRVLILLLTKPMRRVVARTSMEWDDGLANLIRQPVRYIMFGIALIVGVRILDFNVAVVDFATRLSRTLIIASVFVALLKTVDLFGLSARRLFRLTGVVIEDQLLPFIRTAIKLIVIALTLVIIIQEWGYDVSGLIAGLGLGGLAFSLAAKDTVENLFGFSTIVGDQPFVVGEFIVTPEVMGTVEKVGLRSTRIRQLDQALVMVPNNRMANSVVSNWSRLTRRWIQFTFGVTYTTVPEQMEQLIERIQAMLSQREHVDPETIQVIFTDFSDSSLDVLVRCYVDLLDWYDWMKEKEAVNLEVMRIVADLGLSMAFPSRSLYVESVPSALIQTNGDYDLARPTSSSEH